MPSLFNFSLEVIYCTLPLSPSTSFTLKSQEADYAKLNEIILLLQEVLKWLLSSASVNFKSQVT